MSTLQTQTMKKTYWNCMFSDGTVTRLKLTDAEAQLFREDGIPKTLHNFACVENGIPEKDFQIIETPCTTDGYLLRGMVGDEEVIRCVFVQD